MTDLETILGSVRKDHPRMFFNRETWQEVKKRADGKERVYRDKMIERCRSYTDDPHCTGTEAIRFGEVKTPTGVIRITPATPINNVQEYGYPAAECALAWRFTGERIFLEKARKMLIANGIGYTEAYRNGRAVNWYSTTRIMSLCAYDWIYEGLTDEERREIIVPLVQHAEDIQPRQGRPFIIRRDLGDYKTGYYGVYSLMWFAGLAAVGDGYCDELADSLLREGAKGYLEVLTFREYAAGKDGGMPSATPGYSLGAYPWAHYNFFHTVLSATGRNIAGEYPAISLFPNWIYWVWMNSEYSKDIPVYSGSGDDEHSTNALYTKLLYQHMTQHIHFYKDIAPDTARLALSIRNMASIQKLLPTEYTGDTTGYGNHWIMYPFLLDTEYPDIEPFSKKELYDNALKCRHFLGHGQFHMRSGFYPDSTYATFTAGYYLPSHKQQDENSFVIKKHDFLAIDSGTRGKERDYCLRYYYHQTVAHNCVLIHKPNEPFPDTWGPKYEGEEAKTNFGGQSMRPANVLAYETNDLYTYIASDAADCYGEKTPECVRQFVFLYPDTFIVYDRIISQDASYKKEWLLHTVNEPALTDCGFTADCGKGRLFVSTLLPENAVIEKIGGPGKEYLSNGKNWEVEEEFDKEARELAKSEGHQVYFGAWRAVVSPAKASKNDCFLHVLTAGDTGMFEGAKARLAQTETEDGAILTLPDGREIGVYFARMGEVGGRIVTDQESIPFTDKVMEQTGIGIEKAE